MFRNKTAIAVLSLVLSLGEVVSGAEYLSGLEWQAPPVVRPGGEPGAAPSDAVVLFNGADLSAFKGGEQWKVQDGVATVGKGSLVSKMEFGDCQLHIEWSAPAPPSGEGQNRGNSGVFFMRSDLGTGYELQVLDSYKSNTYFDGQAGAIYKQVPPLVNAMRAPGEWNTYDIIWHWPRFSEDGSLLRPAQITALHNGVVVQSGYELQGDTPFDRAPQYEPHAARGPIMLQDHLCPVRFRNIWVREIKPLDFNRVSEPRLR